ncbi:MAG: helix-turn-helix domain-containing protein [Actinobacteria bacterium]|nr:helix-turn-helix domain-containing protein [Actinomycetota bacterium]
MPEIGAMLREARMRAHIDISEIESETKIRAKYLRALENEEWDLLPGPTFVKSFLRTYAEALGLDAKLIVEEFKLRHERPSEFDLQPIRATGAGRERRPKPRPAVPRWAIGLVLVLALVAALYALGNRNNTPTATPPARTPAASALGSGAKRHPATATTRPKRRRVVTLRFVPTGSVYVCLLGDGRKLINKLVLMPGVRQPVYRARKFALTLGNGDIKLVANGSVLTVPQVNNGIGYELTTAGRKILPVGKRPTCA